MKFSDGCWLSKKHFEIRHAEQAYTCEAIPDGFRVIATPAKIHNRGQILGGPNLTVDFFSPCRDVIGVRMTRFGGTLEITLPSFEIDYDERFVPEVLFEDNLVALISGDAEVQVEVKGDWKLSFLRKGKLLTENDSKTTAYIRENVRYKELMSAIREDDYA